MSHCRLFFLHATSPADLPADVIGQEWTLLFYSNITQTFSGEHFQHQKFCIINLNKTQENLTTAKIPIQIL